MCEHDFFEFISEQELDIIVRNVLFIERNMSG